MTAGMYFVAPTAQAQQHQQRDQHTPRGSWAADRLQPRCCQALPWGIWELKQWHSTSIAALSAPVLLHLSPPSRCRHGGLPSANEPWTAIVGDAMRLFSLHALCLGGSGALAKTAVAPLERIKVSPGQAESYAASHRWTYTMCLVPFCWAAASRMW